jgi:IclR family transcriptional regulator, mhp operon transcriptional activator
LTPEAPGIQSVARAIALLRALNRQPVSTLEVLFRQTGIPKPSIVRLLRTFEAEGLVRKAPHYGAYVLASGVDDLSCGYHSEPWVMEAVAPVADALTALIRWPVAVGVLDMNSVVVRYSTIPQSPLSFLHSSIGMRLSLVSRALGRAYLAFCNPQEQAALIAVVAQSSLPEDQLAREPAQVARILADARRLGYALRDPAVRPMSQTIAIPVFEDGKVAATMGITWFTSVHSIEAAVARYLAPLNAAGAEVSARLRMLKDSTKATAAATSEAQVKSLATSQRSPASSTRT